MLTINKVTSFFLLLVLCLISSCGKKRELPSIGNNISFPSSLVSLNSTQFLMLNSSANQDYKDGSVQLYLVDASGNYSLQNSLSVPVHASELAVSQTGGMVALAFDSSVNPTQILFYDYSSPSSPQLINNLSLNLYAAGGKQAIKRLAFFTPTGGGNYYYLTGIIYSYPQDDGSASGIPARVFVARVAKDFSSANVMFTLSYGLGDPNSLAQKSDSLVPYSYSFGTTAPAFDATHNLFLAFPTGSAGGFNNGTSYSYPPTPEPYGYFSGQPNGNTINCGAAASCTQPDMRTNSMFLVDFTAILNGEPLNNSTYFAPLAWNYNGIPYGGVTNGTTLNYPVQGSNSDSSSFSFQSNFWSSYWVNTANLGNGGTACYPVNPTTSANEYNLSNVGANALLVTKQGTNGGSDSGIGNEIFQITGLDIASASIAQIKTLRLAVNQAGESDFKAIAAVQILDPFNPYYVNIQALPQKWLNGNTPTTGVLPVVPYMYSRTTNVSSFYAVASAVGNFSVLNFGGGVCLPYWTRSSTAGFASFGMDSAWLSSSPASLAAGGNPVFSNAVVDPTTPSVFSFPYADGAQTCTDLSPGTSTPLIFCANFLKGNLTRLRTSTGSTSLSLLSKKAKGL